METCYEKLLQIIQNKLSLCIFISFLNKVQNLVNFKNVNEKN